MSEYTQQDLDAAHAIIRAWLEDVKGEAFEQRDRLVKHIAESRASVRAEAQQAPTTMTVLRNICEAIGAQWKDDEANPLPPSEVIDRIKSNAKSGWRELERCRRKSAARLAAAEKLAEACRASVRLLALIRGNGYAGDFLPELDRFIDDDERDNEPNGALAEWEAAK